MLKEVAYNDKKDVKMNKPQNIISWDDFEKVEIRVGTIVDVSEFPEARLPAYKLKVDLGLFGVKKSSAQITKLYRPEDLLNRQVVCVCNFPPKQIGPVMSEVLVTGFIGEAGEVVLAVPDKPVRNGTNLS